MSVTQPTITYDRETLRSLVERKRQLGAAARDVQERRLAAYRRRQALETELQRLREYRPDPQEYEQGGTRYRGADPRHAKILQAKTEEVRAARERERALQREMAAAGTAFQDAARLADRALKHLQALGVQIREEDL